MTVNTGVSNDPPRRLKKVVVPETTRDGAGVVLKRVIGGLSLSYADPFLLLDHFGSDDPDEYIAGFPMHPHRGIETVTYVLSGAIKHRDSEGNEGIIRPGGVQWMTAGSGIIHEEMPQLENGKLEGFQLWVNLPACSKMIRPRYQEFGAGEIPFVAPSDGVEVKVIAGRYGDASGAVTGLELAPDYFDVRLQGDVDFRCPVESGRNAFIYVYRGGLAFSDAEEVVKAPLLALLGEGSEVKVRSLSEGAGFLLVSGAPLNEPIARYGPFVMNTRDEIGTALEELNNGTFVK